MTITLSPPASRSEPAPTGAGGCGCATCALPYLRRRHLLPHGQVPLIRRTADQTRRVLPRRHPGDCEQRRQAAGSYEQPADYLAPPGAYSGRIGWRSRDFYLTEVLPLACRLRPGVLRGHKISDEDFAAWAEVESLYADELGRRCIVRPDSVANLLGWDQHLKAAPRKVQRCRAAARELGIYVTVLHGRMLNYNERKAAQDRGSRMRGLANESGFVVPRWMLPALLAITGTGANARAVDGFVPSSGSVSMNKKEPLNSSSSRRSATTKTPPTAAPARRTGPGRMPPAAWGLARQLQQTVPWLGTEQTGRLVPMLIRYATATARWTAADIIAVMDAHNQRMGWVSLTSARIRTRPAALLAHYLRDVDPVNDHPRGPDVFPPWPGWCGTCDPHTRLVEVDSDTVSRCARCHPLSPQSGC